MRADGGHREEAGSEPQGHVPPGMLYRMPHFVGGHAHSSHTGAVIDVGRKAHRSRARIIVVSELTADPFHTYIVQSVGIENLPGHLGPCKPCLGSFLEIAGKSALYFELGIHGE